MRIFSLLASLILTSVCSSVETHLLESKSGVFRLPWALGSVPHEVDNIIQFRC